MNIYITSDLHLSHRNMAGPEAYSKTRRHFKDYEEMDNYLIKAHNEVVTNNDITYNLGDLFLGKDKNRLLDILNQMKGAFVIIKGNHDYSANLKFLLDNNYQLPNGNMKFTIHEVGFIVKKDKKTYHLTHYPMLVGHLRNNLRNICGHIHEYEAPNPNSINVGIDSPELPTGHKFGAPLLLKDVIELLEAKVQYALDTGDLINAIDPEILRVGFEGEIR